MMVKFPSTPLRAVLITARTRTYTHTHTHENLKTLLEQSLANSKTFETKNVIDESAVNKEVPTEDVLILHDSLFKHVTEGIVKKEKHTVEKVTPSLNDAFKTLYRLLEANQKLLLFIPEQMI